FTGLEPKCTHCSAPLIPSRFIAVCEEGHIEDFPYSAWVHEGRKPDEKKTHELSLRATGGAGSLAGIVIRCTCGEERSMEGAFTRDALRGIRSCGGYRPWLRTDSPGGCGKPLRTTQRGASNVWFSNVRSVLSIPPWSEGLQKFVQANWGTFGLDLDQEELEF